MNAPSPLVVAFDLSYSTPDGRPLVGGLSFAVGRGEVLAITGSNGVGKSTLLRVLLGELRPSSGTLHVGTRSVGFLSQLHNREFHIPLCLADVLSFNGRGKSWRKESTRAGLLAKSDLDLSWNTASGGERQKTLLTQVLLQEPELLILDEPMNHLDSATRQALARILREFVAGGQRGVLLVCHERSLAEADWPEASTLDLSTYARAKC